MGAAPKLLFDRMTVTEFLAWDSGDRSGRHWQLQDGLPTAMAPASENHGAIQNELGRIIGNHLLAVRSACRVVIEPGVVPRIRSAENVRIPDIAVTCTPPRGDRLMQSPVLVVEILSPSNADETRSNVWSYTSIPSVQEILIVSSTRVAAELLRRGADGQWPADATLLGGGDVLGLASVGLDLPLADAYRTTDIV